MNTLPEPGTLVDVIGSCNLFAGRVINQVWVMQGDDTTRMALVQFSIRDYPLAIPADRLEVSLEKLIPTRFFVIWILSYFLGVFALATSPFILVGPPNWWDYGPVWWPCALLSGLTVLCFYVVKQKTGKWITGKWMPNESPT